MKQCPKCNIQREDYGRAHWCKVCLKSYRESRKERIKAAKKKHYEQSKEKILSKCREDYPKYKDRIKEYNKIYSQENKEKIKERRLERYSENPEKILGWVNKRRATKLNASPLWLTKQHLAEIEQHYRLAWSRGMFEEQKFHVDHIVPLQGETVCGLHVPWNLQVIPAKDNISKGNRLVGDMA